MTYPELLAELFGLRRFGIELGLERMQRVLARLGDPQRALPFVHVAGTNGKGSTAAFCEAILRAGGRKTGLFTSPHLSRFTERFRIAGDEVAQDTLCAAAERVRTLGEPLTFFEYAAAIGFLLFAEAGCDAAVIEVGLGGRLDATNAGDGTVQVITGIGFDHMAHLGGTLAQIAGEKAGIMRRGRVTLAALPAAPPARAEVRGALEQAAAAAGARLGIEGEDFSLRGWGPGYLFHGLLHLPDDALAVAARARFPIGELALAGGHQRSNAALALAAAEALARAAGFALPEEAYADGVASARWPGRLEQIADHPPTWVDAAHNPDGAAALAAALRAGHAGEGPLTLVLGTLDDKDGAAIAAELAPLATRLVVTRPPSPRALDPAALAAALPGAEAIDDPAAAIQRARAGGGRVLISGSIFLVAAARELLLDEPRDPLPVAESMNLPPTKTPVS